MQIEPGPGSESLILVLGGDSPHETETDESTETATPETTPAIPTTTETETEPAKEPTIYTTELNPDQKRDAVTLLLALDQIIATDAAEGNPDGDMFLAAVQLREMIIGTIENGIASYQENLVLHYISVQLENTALLRRIAEALCTIGSKKRIKALGKSALYRLPSNRNELINEVALLAMARREGKNLQNTLDELAKAAALDAAVAQLTAEVVTPADLFDLGGTKPEKSD